MFLVFLHYGTQLSCHGFLMVFMTFLSCIS
ncbi:hypothetical protein POPTR_003G073750v4 [Populus trichocarpa]|uniref:Uncharacterized protein n=1 Tax=Populus trichocarpa TaxID=3694 RepID=A0ACC0T857_POPTR|nr:hypothetical protein POPTR_003G073750v4 [Populus trichocarpa]